jgi:hypothetical protein
MNQSNSSTKHYTRKKIKQNMPKKIKDLHKPQILKKPKTLKNKEQKQKTQKRKIRNHSRRKEERGI